MDGPKTQEARELSRQHLGRDEMNLAEFPITVLTDRRPKGVNMLQFKDSHGTLTVLGSDFYGLPTSIDSDVIVGLIQLTKIRNDFTQRKVTFSRYELIKLLGWPDRGRYYERLEESLHRWTTVTLKYNNAWWDNKTKCRTNATFHILSNVAIVEREKRRKLRVAGQQELPFSFFTWDEIFFASCQADNLKRLDLEAYFSLKSAISKQMYRFLDKRFYLRPSWTFDLREFAFEHVGLGRSYADNGILKEKLHPALEELEAIGYLEPMSREERYQKVGRGAWTITLVRKSAGRAQPGPEPKPVQPALPEPTPLEGELIRRGVTPVTATALVVGAAAEAIATKLEVFDWLVETKDKRVAKNPAGYLVDSIRKDYAAPKGFEGRADRARREGAERQRRRQEAEAKCQQGAEQARERALQAQITAYWDGLSRAEQAELEAAALAQAEASLVTSYREMRASRNPLAGSFLKLIRDAYLRKVLNLSAPSPPIP